MTNIKVENIWKISLLLLLLSLYSAAWAEEKLNTKQENIPAEYQIDTLVSDFDSPWSLAFLPNGDQLVTELSGQLRIIVGGKLQENSINGVPKVYYGGQGGLMDVLVDKDFNKNNTIYLSFSHGSASANATRLVSATLQDGSLSDVKILFTASPLKKTAPHYGGRMTQLKDGTLLLNVGDGYDYREQAQKLDNHFGKIIRINTDGTVPSNNPFVKNKNALPEIWSYGHRNMQAILVTPDGTIYENEHGPKGGDEINVIRSGLNYGWPVATYGIDYNGASITPFTRHPGMKQPLVNWTPSIAPSGMTYYQGKQFPQWQGNLFAVSLAQGSVRRINLDGEKVVSDQRVFPELDQRLRDIRTGPDGALYILTDGGNGKLLRISARP